MNHSKLLFASIVVLGLAAPVSAAAQEHNAEAAQQRYTRALSLYEAGRFAEALEEFRASEGMFSSPNSRLFIARTLEQLGDHAGAVTAYELVIPVADDRGLTDVRYLETRRAAERELQEIAPRVARLTVMIPNAPPGLRVQLGTQNIPRDGLGVALAFAPGTIHLRAEAPLFRVEERDIVLEAGTRQEVTVAMQTLPPPAVVLPAPIVVAPVHREVARVRPVRIAAIASGAVALAGFAAFGALAFVTNQNYEALRAQCGDAPCPESARPALDNGRTLQTLTDLSLGVGIAGLAAAGVFLTLGPRIERWIPAFRVAIAPNAFAIDGRF